MIEVRPLADADHAAWSRLAEGYKRFYNTPTSAAEYEQAWQRLRRAEGVHGLGAHLGGQLVGLVHYLFHTSTWAPCVCYLQDLYTDEACRGRGVARALIAAVAQAARAAGASRLYWLTQENNRTARELYDRVAQYKGFIRYDHPL
ncbi:MAG: GNAT family N-acetyltransferase [Burkholderiales bacterium]|nr:GNAT family N-acetyltransferase [Burkholderiales bacterium]